MPSLVRGVGRVLTCGASFHTASTVKLARCWRVRLAGMQSHAWYLCAAGLWFWLLCPVPLRCALCALCALCVVCAVCVWHVMSRSFFCVFFFHRCSVLSCLVWRPALLLHIPHPTPPRYSSVSTSTACSECPAGSFCPKQATFPTPCTDIGRYCPPQSAGTRCCSRLFLCSSFPVMLFCCFLSHVLCVSCLPWTLRCDFVFFMTVCISAILHAKWVLHKRG